MKLCTLCGGMFTGSRELCHVCEARHSREVFGDPYDRNGWGQRQYSRLVFASHIYDVDPMLMFQEADGRCSMCGFPIDDHSLTYTKVEHPVALCNLGTG